MINCKHPAQRQYNWYSLIVALMRGPHNMSAARAYKSDLRLLNSLGNREPRRTETITLGER
jgi:hypothetical protein